MFHRGTRHAWIGIVIALAFASVAASGPAAAAQENSEARKAIERAGQHLQMALDDPRRAAANLGPWLTERSSVQEYVAYWDRIGAGDDGVARFHPVRAVFYDRGPDGLPVDYAAVDFWLLTSAPRLICGYVLLDMAASQARVVREELGVVTAEQLELLSDDGLRTLMQELRCVVPVDATPTVRDILGID